MGIFAALMFNIDVFSISYDILQNQKATNAVDLDGLFGPASPPGLLDTNALVSIVCFLALNLLKSVSMMYVPLSVHIPM